MKKNLRRLFTELKAPGAGPPVILVGHTSAFNAMDLTAPKSGGGLVLIPNGSATPEVAGTITAP